MLPFIYSYRSPLSRAFMKWNLFFPGTISNLIIHWSTSLLENQAVRCLIFFIRWEQLKNNCMDMELLLSLIHRIIRSPFPNKTASSFTLNISTKYQYKNIRRNFLSKLDFYPIPSSPSPRFTWTKFISIQLVAIISDIFYFDSKLI